MVTARKTRRNAAKKQPRKATQAGLAKTRDVRKAAQLLARTYRPALDELAK